MTKPWEQTQTGSPPPAPPAPPAKSQQDGTQTGQQGTTAPGAMVQGQGGAPLPQGANQEPEIQVSQDQQEQKIELVVMVRSHAFPNIAQVHPDEVQNYRLGGWEIKKKK